MTKKPILNHFNLVEICLGIFLLFARACFYSYAREKQLQKYLKLHTIIMSFFRDVAGRTSLLSTHLNTLRALQIDRESRRECFSTCTFEGNSELIYTHNDSLQQGQDFSPVWTPLSLIQCEVINSTAYSGTGSGQNISVPLACSSYGMTIQHNS